MISRGGLFCSSRNAKLYKISHPLQSKATQNKQWDIVLSLERLRDMYRKLAKSELLVKDLYMENSRLIRAIKVHFKLEKSEVADVPKVLPNWLFLYFINVHDISFSTWFFRYFEKKIESSLRVQLWDTLPIFVPTYFKFSNSRNFYKTFQTNYIIKF